MQKIQIREFFIPDIFYLSQGSGIPFKQMMKILNIVAQINNVQYFAIYSISTWEWHQENISQSKETALDKITLLFTKNHSFIYNKITCILIL